MTDRTNRGIGRRGLLLGAGAFALAAPGIVSAQSLSGNIARRNMSAFKMQRWEDHFEQLGRVTLVADTQGRALHWWSADGSDYRMYPTSVPMTEELTRRGYTEVVRKAVAPTWRPTASMLERDPTLPRVVEGGDPLNPLGTHAMYLSWPAYLIHGTQDTRKIGRRSSSGCIGTYNELIAQIYEITPVGAQVRLV
ncbi:L,D-transpeptidase [Palleronia sediminis]|uniref:L,D-transpeptidase n=1 Tax=Palleronia sediminis TaxID=2547833 RepID=A0A4R6AE62_9RHOB|nr:L,D-transpeptidase [Palleronia sediminis]TDL81322.1 L,D-transpeptidase [Palleronia sediminis]